MLRDQLKPSVIVRGPIFPEPVQVISGTPIGKSINRIGTGGTAGQLHPAGFGSCAPGTWPRTCRVLREALPWMPP